MSKDTEQEEPKNSENESQPIPSEEGAENAVTKKLEKEVRAYQLSIITREAQRRGFITKRESLTKTRLLNFANEVGLKGKEKLMLNRRKNLSGQSDNFIKLFFLKLNYQPSGTFEKHMKLVLDANKLSKKVKTPTGFNFDDMLSYYLEARPTLVGDLNLWVFGADMKNSLANQSITFEVEDNV